ncbi:lysostaphin resistance A-like protein [Methanoregula sp.]|uniref:CPBP family intramembrane glutamic endopeptidase n=1 Tax=Methanoregula sp. TaxID=2052170 RepID=UPI003561FD66
MTAVLPDRETVKKELIVFLALTFGATYLLELAGIAMYGSGILANKLMIIPMYIPAVSAILCMVYFKSTALTREAKIFLAAFLVASAVSLFEGLFQPILGTIGPLPLCTVIVSVGAFLVVVIQNLDKPKRESLAPARLSFGKNYRYYLGISLIFSALFILGLLISHYAGLALPAQEYNPGMFFTFMGIYLVTFFVAWPKYFGEEYGWRFYLQDRLFALCGGYKGVVLVGLIWGLWHLPLSLMGLNFPANLVMGNLVYLVYAIVVGIIFSYAVLKTESIWVAVLLHAITDSLVVVGYPYLANGQILVAFLPLLVLLGVLAALLLKSKIWIEECPAPASS